MNLEIVGRTEFEALDQALTDLVQLLGGGSLLIGTQAEGLYVAAETLRGRLHDCKRKLVVRQIKEDEASWVPTGAFVLLDDVSSEIFAWHRDENTLRTLIPIYEVW